MQASAYQLPTTIFRVKSGKQIFLRLFSDRVPAGFPSPAGDYVERSIDLNDWLVKNKIATFILEVDGDSMAGEIHHGDRILVDRSLDPHHGDIVVACVDGEVTVKRLVFAEGKTLLAPENPAFTPIEINEEMDFFIWGVVTFTIHKVH